MFRWVEIWLELLIPETQSGGKTIQFDKHAKQRLKELKEDTTPKFDPDQRLTKAYQRLWDLNSTVDLEFASISIGSSCCRALECRTVICGSPDSS